MHHYCTLQRKVCCEKRNVGGIGADVHSVVGERVDGGDSVIRGKDDTGKTNGYGYFNR